jgi:alkylation response protein AidB-like acyl-CoA dehydrogenase
MAHEQLGRDDLAAWRAARPTNYYDAAPNLARAIEAWAGAVELDKMAPRLRHFGAVMATVVDPAVTVVERHRQFPAHVAYDAIGERRQAIEFHPAYAEVGRAVWASGMLAGSQLADHFEMAGLFYLLSHVGEGGHACPVVCTAGLIRALEHRGDDDLKARFLPALHSADYDHALRGSQFLTEIQGGSDVGANVTAAVPDAEIDGAWRLSGEKWFCSVADADLFAVTARPEGAGAGTRGLGCFVVPRTLDGRTPNGFRIRRLKDKLGTRSMASAEIDFEGALAWPVGPVDVGFRVAVEELLNTSRWLNAVGSTGIMRRAYLEASSFARHRRAFGTPIAALPAVREQLALMKVEEQASLSSTLALTAMLTRLDDGAPGEHDAGAYRLLVNANKYVTSISGTAMARQGIEVLGGNGTIEDFSPLPRLYRDAIVYESWEGTHNVLCAQVLRDCARLGVLDPTLAWTRATLAATGEADSAEGRAVAAALDALQPRMRRSVEAGVTGAAAFRRQLERLVRAVQGACLLHEAGASRGDAAKRAAASLHVRRHLVPGHEPEDDAGWSELVGEVLAGDAG